jgi:cellulose synthase/poly-beta-1,6-N-acetylglucosamine synthase-like glycosyltransferase
MKVSLVATVRNAEEHVGAFLASIAAQSRAPDEVVVVDGGSTDGTLALLRAADGVTVLDEPGANIARGRNVAIAHASHEAIAVADADCVYGPDWLAALVAPLEAGADVAMGVTEPIVGSLLDACVASLSTQLEPTALDPVTFMPSARSVAFRREAIDAVGGYPEWLPIGEDMWVDHRWRERSFDMRLAPDAVAGWRPRGTLGEIWTQYMRYARGDGQAGMHVERHLVRAGVYASLVAALGSRRVWPKLLALAGGVAYARGPVRRARRRAPDRALAAAMLTPLLLAFTDVAKLFGYALGVADRLRGRVRPPQPYS